MCKERINQQIIHKHLSTCLVRINGCLTYVNWRHAGCMKKYSPAFFLNNPSQHKMPSPPSKCCVFCQIVKWKTCLKFFSHADSRRVCDEKRNRIDCGSKQQLFRFKPFAQNSRPGFADALKTSLGQLFNCKLIYFQGTIMPLKYVGVRCSTITLQSKEGKVSYLADEHF